MNNLPSKIVKGNLIELAKTDQFDVIIHGCNCFNNMGAGIAKQIKQHFPLAYQADLSTKKGYVKKLGSYSSANIITDNYQIIVVNAYTQYTYGRGLQIDYDAIQSVFAKIKAEFSELRIAYPKIGAGLGGGDWNLISNIINQELTGCNHTLVIYQ